MGRFLLNYSELYTILTDIESAINQRPLTYQGTDPNDLQAITLAHLALGRSLGQLPEIPFKAARLSNRVNYINILFIHFWSRWTREYLPPLQVRNKWKQGSNSSLDINDIVLISEDNVRRGAWPIGRVVKVITGADRVPRTARIRTKNGEFTRPFQKLYLFGKYAPAETQCQNENPSEQFLNNHALQQRINNEQDIYINDGQDVLRESETSQAGEDVIIPHITT